MNQEILRRTDDYYTEKIEAYGATSKGVDWNSVESQRERFQQLTRILSNESKNDIISICDYGCGYGYYFEYLMENNFCFNYSGYDVSEKMLRFARNKYGAYENVNFVHGAEIKTKYDYIVASGIFNVRQDIEKGEWNNYILEILQKFNNYSNKGFAFNCLTKYSDGEFMKEYLFYGDPLFYFDYCKQNFSRNVALLHDYNLYEFTILVRKLGGGG